MPKAFNADQLIIEQAAPMLKLDSGQSIFFARELEHVKSRTYDIKYPALKAASGELIPISTEAGPGAESITYEQFDQVGMAKIVSNYADDLPAADVNGKEFNTPVKSIGTSYVYNIQEIRAAAMAGRPLNPRKAAAARRANDIAVNQIALTGNAESGLPGLLTNPNVQEYTLPTDGDASGTTFASKISTPNKIIRDLNAMVTQIVSTSKGVHAPNVLALPPETIALIGSTPRSENSDTTILDYFLQNNSYIDRVIDVPELSTAGTGNKAVALVYEFSPEIMTLELPQPFEQMPVQPKNLAFNVPCHSRIGGVLIYYPIAICKAIGI